MKGDSLNEVGQVQLKDGTPLMKLVNCNDTGRNLEYTTWTAGEGTPPAGALTSVSWRIGCKCNIEVYIPTVMRATLTKYLETDTDKLRKIKMLLHQNR